MSAAEKYLLVVLPLVSLTACGPSRYALTSEGDTANIETKTGSKVTGELLCIQDSSVYILGGEPKGKVIRLAVSDVTHVEIDGYANRHWVTPVILFQAIPAVLLAIAASSVDRDNLGVALLIFGLPTALTYIAFEASTPSPPQSANPKTIHDVQHLSQYARFPQGLTDTQFLEIFQRHNQTAADVLH